MAHLRFGVRARYTENRTPLITYLQRAGRVRSQIWLLGGERELYGQTRKSTLSRELFPLAESRLRTILFTRREPVVIPNRLARKTSMEPFAGRRVSAPEGRSAQFNLGIRRRHGYL